MRPASLTFFALLADVCFSSVHTFTDQNKCTLRDGEVRPVVALFVKWWARVVRQSKCFSQVLVDNPLPLASHSKTRLFRTVHKHLTRLTPHPFTDMSASPSHELDDLAVVLPVDLQARAVETSADHPGGAHPVQYVNMPCCRPTSGNDLHPRAQHDSDSTAIDNMCVRVLHSCLLGLTVWFTFTAGTKHTAGGSPSKLMNPPNQHPGLLEVHTFLACSPIFSRVPTIHSQHSSILIIGF